MCLNDILLFDLAQFMFRTLAAALVCRWVVGAGACIVPVATSDFRRSAAAALSRSPLSVAELGLKPPDPARPRSSPAGTGALTYSRELHKKSLTSFNLCDSTDYGYRLYHGRVTERAGKTAVGLLCQTRRNSRQSLHNPVSYVDTPDEAREKKGSRAATANRPSAAAGAVGPGARARDGPGRPGRAPCESRRDVASGG
ncbi:hypothetical protein EVAR_21423_1 [Eumeta japonica]|uniref:Uncharacterized protein n=1 Tax=Eumeta variegata TaxID=151549 RepID=A0A4C1VFK7_EUMVA|nr:hypothetical protein EVAR_21423_1 [Eumeta japonica]